MIDRALNFVQEHIPDNWFRAAWAFFATLTIIDVLDLLWKCVTGCITLFFFYLGWLRHKAAMKVKALEIEKLEQEIGDLIQENKRKHG